MIWLAFVVGAFISGTTTYFATVHFKQMNAIRENVRFEKLESYHQGRKDIRDSLSIEREVYYRRSGVIIKRLSLVISERVLLDGIPISPYAEQVKKVNQELDKNELASVVEAIQTASGFDFSKIGVKVINSTLKR